MELINLEFPRNSSYNFVTIEHSGQTFYYFGLRKVFLLYPRAEKPLLELFCK